MKYTVNYFIKKFEKTKPSQWTTGTFKNLAGQCCALGHCGGSDSIESMFLKRILKSVVAINDNYGFIPRYLKRLKSPRSRILAALKRVKKDGKW